MGHDNHSYSEVGKNVREVFKNLQEYYENYESKSVHGSLIDKTSLFESDSETYYDRFERLHSPSPIWYHVETLPNGDKKFYFDWWMRC
jgi:hypothetical protein